MKILLLNDNPVVRKLVALSAQKTKDDLSVIWSVDEVEGAQYDLLIVDDAHYSDEAMGELQQKIQYKSSLLMATRGNATPAGFDKIINKPFLPTDLVDLFSQIAKELTPVAQKDTETKKAIVLDDALEQSPEEEGFDITNLDDDLNLDDFDIEEDVAEVKTKVLDHEEVQELQGLLDDTDNIDLEDEVSLDSFMEEETDEVAVEDEDILGSLDNDILQALESDSLEVNPENELDDAMEEFDFDEELLAQSNEPAKVAEEVLDDEDLLGSLDDLMDIDDTEDDIASEESAPIEETFDEDLDALLLDGLEDLDQDEESLSQEVMDEALSDDEFGELEQQIQEAVEELGIEDLEQGFEDVEMGGLGDFEGLDSLSERDIKLAIGEEVEEEPEVRIGRGSHASLDAEALSEAMGELHANELDDELEDMDLEMPTVVQEAGEHHATPAEGMDALQALLKALSNEEVSKTLKGLSINININFGNEK